MGKEKPKYLWITNARIVDKVLVVFVYTLADRGRHRVLEGFYCELMVSEMTEYFTFSLLASDTAGCKVY
jgi:hypothetical protein